MPLPDPVDREAVHRRAIDLQAWRRRDGLYDIEAHLVDTKSAPFMRALNPEPIPAGEPLHDLWVRLVIDDHFLVHDAIAASDVTPFPVCREATGSLKVLVGECIGAGWSKLVKERLRGAAGCTHLMELLMPLATVAIQAMVPITQQRPLRTDANGRPRKIDSCYAYAAEREVVKALWPQFHGPSRR
jgi:hypothetical protein